MLNTHVYNKIKRLPLLLATLSITSFCQANDFYNHSSYNSFKQKTMQNYNLTAEQIDWAMNGSKNLPNIINIMNRPGESKPWYEYKTNFMAEGTIQRGIRLKINMQTR